MKNRHSSRILNIFITSPSHWLNTTGLIWLKKTMFEKIKEQMGFIDVPVIIEMRNGRSIHGLLIDYLAGQENNISEWKFISYNNLSKYKESENPKYFEKLVAENISGVDICVR